MTRPRPTFRGVLVLVGASCLVTAGVGGWYQAWAAASRARAELARNEERLRGVERMRPAPTLKTVRLLTEARASATAAADTLAEHLAGNASVPSVPSNRSEAFFELAQFVHTMRTQARQAGVACREHERFGFSAYTRTGPATAVLERVHAQRWAMQSLLDALLAAGPERLESVQRTRPDSAVRGKPPASGEVDFFVPDTHISLLDPTGPATTAFRFVFLGNTASLRAWLNRLVTLPGPVLVRDVTAEAVAAPAEAAGSAQPPGRAVTRFTVVVEVVHGAAAPAGPSTAGNPSGGVQ